MPGLDSIANDCYMDQSYDLILVADGRPFDCIDVCSSSDELPQDAYTENIARKRRFCGRAYS